MVHPSSMQHTRPASDPPTVPSSANGGSSAPRTSDDGMSACTDDLFPRPQARASLGTRIASGVFGALLVAVGIVLGVPR
ncbi:MAG: hypothetical protein RL354_2636 [Planctomycetota bacterium]